MKLYKGYLSFNFNRGSADLKADFEDNMYCII